MPGMKVFNRRWAIATDDFLFIGVVDAIIFSAWLGWCVIVYCQYSVTSCGCFASLWCHLLHAFLLGSCCLFALNTLLAVSFIIFSTRGTISEPGSRRHVTKLVQVKLILSLLDLCWAIVGSVLFGNQFTCRQLNIQYYVKVICISYWVIFVARLGLVWVIYDPRGKLNKSNKQRKTIPNEYLSPPAPLGSSKKWRHRLQAFCLWFTAPSEDRRIAISTVSELLAFLSYDLDLVASDLITGLILYRRRCLKQFENDEEKLKSLPKISLHDGTVIQSFPPEDLPQWMNLKLASRYFSIGMGIFGWPWVLYRNLAHGMCQILKKCVVCFPCRRHSSNVEGDNCCGCNLAGLRTTSGCTYQDLIHVCFVNRVYQIPFFVSIDHDTSSVVLTVRGSMSCSDALTDLSAAFEPIDECNFPKDTLCHGGFLVAARRIKARLEEKQILENAFAANSGYRLVLTGHSLGAGVASLLTLMYKNTYEVRCFAFAPPPVMNEAGLSHTFDCVFTVIYGNDVVPYLNYWNVRNMIVDAVDLLNKCKLPKHKVLLGNEGVYTGEEKSSATESVDVETGCDPQNPVLGSKSSENSGSPVFQAEANGCANKPENRTRFFVPGKILSIKHSKKYGYRLRMCDAAEFQPLLCKRRMVLHHFPTYMEMTLNSLGADEVLQSDGMGEDSDPSVDSPQPAQS